jgi:hydrophobic/amphiphilic exporter-1 (mainly G- bacteria), HAE1 family
MIVYFTRHPTAANLLMITLLFLGLTAIPKLKRETLPDITPNQLRVSAVYPGASAEAVEKAVVTRIEEAIDGIEFVKEIISDCREGIGAVTVEMATGGNSIVFKDEIATAVKAINDFPTSVETPIVSQIAVTDRVLTILVTGDLSTGDLKTHCESIKRRLVQIPEVDLVDVRGFSERQIRVELSIEAIRRFGLTVKQVADLVRGQNSDSPAGGLDSDQRELLLRFADERRTLNDLKQLVVLGNAYGSEVLLGDITTVTESFSAEEQKTLLNGQRAGVLVVRKSKADDIIRIADAVRRFVQQEQERYPMIALTISGDSSSLVQDRLALLLKNGGQGFVLVFATLWLFFNWRLSFWVAASLPVSFLGAIFFMPLLGLSINMFTLLGMLLALGILMDDGIVIAENVAAHRSRGATALQAAIDGVSEVAAGVFSSFITTVCVLGPLAFISGRIGEVLGVIPVMLIFVLSISLIEAFFILPAHLGHALEHGGISKSNRWRRRIDAAFEFLRERVFGTLVDAAVSHRYLTLGLTVGTLLATMGLLASGTLKFLPFPQVEGDTVVARVVLPAGTPLERTESVMLALSNGLDRVNSKLQPAQPGSQPLVLNRTLEYGINTEAFESGPHVATMTVELLTVDQRTARIDDVIAAWKQEVGSLADVMLLTISADSFGPAGRPIELRLKGNELAELKLASAETLAWFSQFKGVRNLSDDLRQGKPEVQFRLATGATALGLTTSSVAEQVRAGFQGVDIGEVQLSGESRTINVSLKLLDRDGLSDLDSFPISLADGRLVPLATVADQQPTRGWSRISRADRSRAVTVFGDVDSRITSGSALVARFRIEQADALLDRFPGVQFDFGGETKESRTTVVSLLTGAAIGLVGVFVLLSFQFRSYFEPLVVMAAIPFALVGVLWGHVIVGIDMTMPSALGFASLGGIVVNDSILLVLFLKEQRLHNTDILSAATSASRERFRAIVLTSLTTVAGLLPLIFETSLQAQVLIPMAVSIAFGIMTSTVLVLLVVPSLYAILADFGLVSNEVDVSG